ncbi:MAG: c-type cytochrome biogenesis protein CcmI [Gammaproteobacteria bacterium]
MTIFWLVAVLLIVAALLFVIPPLLKFRESDHHIDRRSLNINIYRDQIHDLEQDLENDVITQDQYDQGKLELEKRLLEDVSDDGQPESRGKLAARSTLTSAIILGIAPVFVVSLYLTLGKPELIDGESSTNEVASAGGEDKQHSMSELDSYIEKLEQYLQQNPDDVEKWAMLGRTYYALGRYQDAAQTMGNAMSAGYQEPNFLVDYADALAMTTDRSLEGKPMNLIKRALRMDPNNQKALWLSGTAAYEKGDFESALRYWQRLKSLVPPGSEDAKSMQANIDEAKSLIISRGGVVKDLNIAVDETASVQQAKSAGKSVSGVVKLDPEFSSTVNPLDTVFVFARAPQGPKMPLAIIRARVDELPLDFSLDDSTAMNPSMSISRFSEVVIVARVSKSGNASPQSGDIQGTSKLINVGAKDVSVVINELLP